MIADKKTLEFDKVLELVERHAVSTMGKQAVLALSPHSDKDKLEISLDKTDEALITLYKLGEVPLDNVRDIKPHIKRVKASGSLSSKELREIAMHLYAVNENKNFLKRAKQEMIELPYYTEAVNKMVFIKEIYQSINRCIDEDYNLLDSASEKLFEIRTKIRNTNGKIEEKLNSFVSRNSKFLSDGIVTRRNDRFVVPLRVDYKNKFKGIIQDYSSSGETVFIEPQVIVELTNKVQILKSEEQREIERILHELSEEAKLYADIFMENLAELEEIDLVFAKAKFARDFDCTKPKLSDKISLRAARHPLISQDEIVANDIHFDDYKAVVITGPNTGGKTVTLKTLGLMALMTQVGMLIPVKAGSEIIVFDNIFADIGDEQSIEQSLSTFSSHMKNIIRITDSLTVNSLVLLDELGSGTDPKEGASLAISLLDYVKIRGSYIMATTHYPELKAYAYNNEDVVNASTNFDIDSLSPTYELSIGIPGRSNAFEISKRLGLNEKILKTATDNQLDSNTEVSKLIDKLEKQSRNLKAQLEEYERQMSLIKDKEMDLYKREEMLARKSVENENKAKEEAKEIVENARAEAQGIIDELMKYSDDVKLHKLVESKTKLNQLAGSYDKEKYVTPQKHTFKVGDHVKVVSYGQSAVITKVLKGSQYEVKMGILNTKVNKSDLEFVGEKKKTVKKTFVKYSGSKTASLKLDLRGLRYEEAMIELDRYLDSLVVSNLKQAIIIHGHGTNALKNGVQETLRKSKVVKSFRFGKPGEGGLGATVIELH